MTRYARIALLSGGTLLACCSDPESSSSRPQPDSSSDSRGHAIAAVSKPEQRDPEPLPPPPGFNPFTAPSQGPVGSLRLGRGISPDGAVPDSQRTDVFMSYDPIHISMNTSELPAGALGRLMIYEDGRDDVAVWGDAQSVTAQKSPFSFEVGPGKLPAKRYRAVLILDGERVADQTFEVKVGSEARSVAS